MPYNGTTPPPKPQNPDVASLHKRSGCRDTLFVVGGVVLSFALVIGGCAAYAIHGLNNLDFGYDSTPRRHLHAIPISKTACPNVVAMHKAANAFQTVTAGFLYAPDPQPQPWPKRRAQLLRATNELDFVVLASTPKFPPRVRHYLTKVHKNLTLGRRKIVHERDGVGFLNRTSGLLAKGQLAFGYAGDLIGHQCRVPLSADTETMLGPLATSPTTRPAAPNTSGHRKH
jgi:hypothetical protein